MQVNRKGNRGNTYFLALEAGLDCCHAVRKQSDADGK